MSTPKDKIDNLGEADGAAFISQAESRQKQIVKTSIIGIFANVLLAVFKAIVGIISGSIAITLDAVNNISDAASSVITIIGTKLAHKPADKKHPFGYGRIEYLSAVIISVIVLYAGITSLEESVKKIIHPQQPDYTMVTLIIVAAGVIVKILLGRYVEGVGKKVNSDSLVASGKDATNDSVISASTLVAAIIFMVSGLSLEAWLGAIISVVIVKSGIDMLKETLSEILGEKNDVELAQSIKKTVLSFDGVSGVYDLVLNNYGPDYYNGSLHIEIPDTYNADEIDELTRKISYKVYEENQVILTAISVYSINTRDPQAVAARKQAHDIVFSVPYVLQMHGFYLDKKSKTLRLDVVISFDSPDRQKTYQEVITKLKAAFPDYQIAAVMDTDFSEE